MTRISPRRIRFQRLENRRLLAVTGIEQEAIYLLNRARHDPTAYALEQNLPVTLSSVAARGPLAVNDALSESADTKTIDMVVNGYFGHVGTGGIQANFLARQSGYPLPDFYSDDQNFIESIAGGAAQPNETLNRLIVDDGLIGAPHRQQLLGISEFYQAHREIGVSHLNESTAAFQDYWVIHTAQRDVPTNHLTGVVFADADGDRRYDAGEGLSGVTITINSSQVVTSNDAGGWSAAVDAGIHVIVAQGGAFQGVATATVTTTSENVAVDFVSGEVTSDVTFEQRFAVNPANRFDVNGEDGVTALDALQVVNFLRRQASGSLVSEIPLFLDVNQENDVTALDALQVINELGRLGSEPETMQIPLDGGSTRPWAMPRTRFESDWVGQVGPETIQEVGVWNFLDDKHRGPANEIEIVVADIFSSFQDHFESSKPISSMEGSVVQHELASTFDV